MGLDHPPERPAAGHGGGGALTVRDLMRRARPGGWMAWAGAYGQGRTALPATLVVGRGLSVLPAH